MKQIPVSETVIGKLEEELIAECLRSGWVSSTGKFVDQFEQEWAAYCGREYGIAVSNGTSALHLAVAALGLEPGDEVIIPTFTIISCALAVINAGGIPVLVDCDPDNWCMAVDQIEGKITPQTRALMVVHMYGHPADMNPILQIAERHHLAVIEDAAEAHGAEYLDRDSHGIGQWRRCGSFGTLSTFSFYGNKIITTGEGGMVLTDDPALADKMRSLRNLGFQPSRRFCHDQMGFNFRLTNLQAALGLAQIQRIEEILARKRWQASIYHTHLRDVAGLQLPIEESWARSVFWMYAVVVAEQRGIDADELARRMREYGVETRPFFLGMHEQPVFRRRGLFLGESYPVAERIARLGLYLPSGLGLTESQLIRVSESVKESLA